MKRIFSVILMMTIISFSQVRACDICGCGVDNYYIGILPQFNHTFFGFRYHFSRFNTRLTNDPTQFSRDFYQTVEGWGGWNISKRFQVLAFVPYNFNRQISDEGISRPSGVGDITFLGNYRVFESQSVANSKAISQEFWVGGGIKLPTGRFNIEANDADVAAVANGQLGSGSTDLLFNAMYNLHINKLGVNTTASYKTNSRNKDQYKFGDRLTVSSVAYYAIPVSKAMISPNLGFSYEHTQESQLQRKKVDMTDGSILNGSLGAEVSFNKVTVGFNLQLPVAQNFAENQTMEKLKGMFHISFAI
jgi:hypothetical protein